MGAQFAKSKTIHKFDDLSQNGFHDLIDDITSVYHHYCKNRLRWESKDKEDTIRQIDIAEAEIVQLKTIPKFVLKNIDRCSEYLLEFSIGHSFHFPGERSTPQKLMIGAFSFYGSCLKPSLSSSSILQCFWRQ